jgi:hypothetical protein
LKLTNTKYEGENVMKQYFYENGNIVDLSDKTITLKKNEEEGFYYVHDFCHRCGGYGGSDAWKFTGWTCYRCNGSGQKRNGRILDPGGPRKIRFYTQECLDKRAIAAAKRAQKKIDKQNAALEIFKEELGGIYACAEHFAQLNNFVDSVLKTITSTLFISDKQECALLDAFSKTQKRIIEKEAEKDSLLNSFIGNIGERMETELESMKVLPFESQFGTFYINILRDSQKNVVIYKGSAPLREGEKKLVKFTVKSHDIYKEVNQTVIARMTYKKN